MSAYAFSTLFKALPPLGKSSKGTSDNLNELKAVAAPAPAPPPSTITGVALPPLKLPMAINNRLGSNDCPKTPTSRHRHRRGSTTAAAHPAGDAEGNTWKTTDPSIWVESANLNAHLLTMSPRKIIRRGFGGNGLAYSPRRQARTVGGNGILDAVEVIMTVTSSGRTYKATRSLARIVELSTDLIADAMAEEDVAAIPILPGEVKLMTLVPPPSSSMATCTASGGGLLHLQDRLDCVRDVLNVWFRRLLASVDAPNSVALSAFLWEPLWLADDSAGGGGVGSNGGSIKGIRRTESSVSASDVPLVESLSNDSSQSTNSGDAGGGVAAPTTKTDIRSNNGSSYSGGALPPLAFGPNRSWRPVRVRRGSADSVSTLSSIDESLLF
mmetsp:Transcript_20569/g.59000  ORF Transcript_20569/g.59000 Transcript_20569/m.59000 type:complete len:383 (+) Transcript_20569:767-1915(+)